MWLSKQSAARPGGDGAAPLRGTVTISGAEVAAFTDAERRGMLVCAPGGYFWRPGVGEDVLVIKEPGGRTPYVIGALSLHGVSLGPGEVLIETGEASLRLSPDGSIQLQGKVTIGGKAVVTK